MTTTKNAVEVMRRTFAACKQPAGSAERSMLNQDPLTSEYFRSQPYMTRERALMSDGTPNQAQHFYVNTFKTKAEAIAAAEKNHTI